MQSTRNRIADHMHDTADSSREFVGEHPMSTTLTAFGVGLGVGVALVYLLADDASQRHAGIAHKLGRQMLDAMSKAVPDSLPHFGR